MLLTDGQTHGSLDVFRECLVPPQSVWRFRWSLDNQEVVVRFSAKVRNVIVAKASELAVGPTQLLVHGVPQGGGAFPGGVKRPRNETGHTPFFLLMTLRMGVSNPPLPHFLLLSVNPKPIFVSPLSFGFPVCYNGLHNM